MEPEALPRRVVPEVLLRQAVLEEPVVALRPFDDLAAVVLLRQAGAEGKDAERVEQPAAIAYEKKLQALGVNLTCEPRYETHKLYHK